MRMRTGTESCVLALGDRRDVLERACTRLQQHVGVRQLQWGDALVPLRGREEGGQRVAAPGWRY